MWKKFFAVKAGVFCLVSEVCFCFRMMDWALLAGALA